MAKSYLFALYMMLILINNPIHALNIKVYNSSNTKLTIPIEISSRSSSTSEPGHVVSTDATIDSAHESDFQTISLPKTNGKTITIKIYRQGTSELWCTRTYKGAASPILTIFPGAAACQLE
ncbi:MAG: hypothetical protein K2P93_01495 [Alphaproteobacteria bacterium]|nr:hypothetical protein [Alphaproteobacteria bacterium]